jgi:glycosyltransferase involved in cell wall biosynthesis
MNKSILLSSVAYRDYLLASSNMDVSISGAEFDAEHVYYHWLRWRGGFQNIHLLSESELAFLSDLVDTPVSFRISMLTKILIEGDCKRRLSSMSGAEFMEALGVHLRFVAPQLDLTLFDDEIEELVKLDTSCAGWLVPMFFLALAVSSEDFRKKVASVSISFVLGWFVDQVVNETPSKVTNQFFGRIVWDLCTKRGFELEARNESSALQRYLCTFYGYDSFPSSASFDHFLPSVPPLVSQTRGLYFEGGVTLVGMVKGELGIGEDVRQVAKALSAVGVNFSIFPFPTNIASSQSNTEFDHKISPILKYDTLIFNLTAEETLRFVAAFGVESMANRYVIGYWPWELSLFPEPLVQALDYIDEVWAPSEFIASSIRFLTAKPVHVMGLPVEYAGQFETDKIATTNYFSENVGFKVLNVFDGLSYPSRKNPFGAIDAFRKAFGDRLDVELIVKTMNLGRSPAALELSAQVESLRNVRVLDVCLGRDDVLALVSEADCLLSLHRSEGFGRVLAEAMLVETPVIASHYSGNQDFCTSENSYGINGEMVAVGKGEYPYSEGQEWLEPSITEAAAALCELEKTRGSERVASIVANARDTILNKYSASVMGGKFENRLRYIWDEIIFRKELLFDTTFYRVYNTDIEDLQPLQHYIEHGWKEGRRTSASKLRAAQLQMPKTRLGRARQKILVAVHSFYPEENHVLAQYLTNLANHDYDVVVNIPDCVATEQHQQTLKEVYGVALKRILVSENRGRDIGGLLQIISSVKKDTYDVVFVLHTKKSPQNRPAYTDFWRASLLTAILGSRSLAARVVSALRSPDSTVGFVGSASWRSTTPDANLDQIKILFERLDVPERHRFVEYLSGSIYAVRFSLLQRLANELKLTDFELTTGKDSSFLKDGQVEHAVERLFGALLSEAHMRILWV